MSDTEDASAGGHDVSLDVYLGNVPFACLKLKLIRRGQKQYGLSHESEKKDV